MSTSEVPVIQAAPKTHSHEWHRNARRARLLSWFSLIWMTIEGAVAESEVEQARRARAKTWR